MSIFLAYVTPRAPMGSLKKIQSIRSSRVCPAIANIKIYMNKELFYIDRKKFFRRHKKVKLNVQIHFKDIDAKIYAKFHCKNCAICLLLFKAFQKIKSQNPMIGSRFKYRYSRVKVK